MAPTISRGLRIREIISRACTVLLLVSSPSAITQTSDADQRHYRTDVYVWAAGVGGETATGAELDIDFTDLAKDLAMTGRLISGEEAGRIGLVTEVADDPLAAARERAALLASKPVPAIRGIKELFRETWTAPTERALGFERAIQTRVLARRAWDMVRSRG